jgi:hypothetical protein
LLLLRQLARLSIFADAFFNWPLRASYFASARDSVFVNPDIGGDRAVGLFGIGCDSRVRALAEAGHTTPKGVPYSASAVSSMLAA